MPFAPFAPGAPGAPAGPAGPAGPRLPAVIWPGLKSTFSSEPFFTLALVIALDAICVPVIWVAATALPPASTRKRQSDDTTLAYVIRLRIREITESSLRR